MILLDTNVISELMKASPAAKVLAWFDQRESAQLYISTITIAEIAYGLNALSPSKRRTQLEDIFHQAVAKSFKHRILSFDEAAAHLYGQIMGQRKAKGRPLSILDGQIAAIARSNNALLATRNIRDFVACGIELLNPFDAP